MTEADEIVKELASVETLYNDDYGRTCCALCAGESKKLGRMLPYVFVHDDDCLKMRALNYAAKMGWRFN